MSKTRQVRVLIPPECTTTFINALTAEKVRVALKNWDGSLRYLQTSRDWASKNLRLGMSHDEIKQAFISRLPTQTAPAATVIIANAIMQLFHEDKQ